MTITPELVDKLWRLHIDHGMRATELSKRFGLSTGAIGRHLLRRRKEAGMPVLTRAGCSEFGSVEARKFKPLPAAASSRMPCG